MERKGVGVNRGWPHPCDSLVGGRTGWRRAESLPPHLPGLCTSPSRGAAGPTPACARREEALAGRPTPSRHSGPGVQRCLLP